MKRAIQLLLCLLSICASASAHVGSPDVFVDTNAGPYKLYVTMQPPQVIPGVASIEVRTSGPAVSEIQITPMPLTGEGADHPPTPDAMHRSAQDPQFFTGNLWLMSGGSWQVRFQIDGAAGLEAVSVPVSAVPTTTLKMARPLGTLLALLGVILIAGLVGIVAAGLREAQLPPEALPGRRNRHRAAVATGVALAVLLAAVGLGGRWWSAEAASHANNIYRPLNMQPKFAAPGLLELAISDPRDRNPERLDNFIPDHGHLMHLYAVRWPGLDIVYHLHPARQQLRIFLLQLPTMPAGEYRLYADVVHATGFPETLVTQIQVPPEVPQNSPGRNLSGDDAMGTAPPVSESAGNTSEFQLPDSYRMQWDRPADLVSKRATEFRFKLVDKNGNTPHDMALYMGMTGHAAFIKDDGSVFAHVHPSGTASMAAMMIASQQIGKPMAMPTAPTDTVTFPYGFPTAGRYRIIVQMKHGETIATGIFDANVAASH